MAASIALTHHERFDGAGYPAGIGGPRDPGRGPDRGGGGRVRRAHQRPGLPRGAAGRRRAGDDRRGQRHAVRPDGRRAAAGFGRRGRRDPPRATPTACPPSAAGFFARYIARSASCSSPAGVSGPSPLSATPMLASNRSLLEVAIVGSAERRPRCAPPARPRRRGPVTFSRTSTNSSPPQRATVSLGRTAPQDPPRRPPAARGRRRSWPCSSLISLKPSRSMNSTAIRSSVRRDGGQRMLEAVLEQRAVGQPGERVVERVVGVAGEGAAALDRDAGQVHRFVDQLQLLLARARAARGSRGRRCRAPARPTSGWASTSTPPDRARAASSR